ncbi:hypothetical protein [Segetibacter koreensis]|uniref:hypothetical protein n=1 Tax=Segetibacter koreensis TaxID=398037 RepID=UPI000381FEB2|nr:hypothetical protein [Segetibacter koreensis]
MLYSVLYFLCTLLNFALIIYFIVRCFRAAKLIKEKHGLLVSVFFIIGLFSVMARPVESNINHSNKLLNLSEEDVDHTKINSYKYIIVDKMGLRGFKLLISYGYFKGSNDILPYAASTSIIGLVGGHTWKPTIIVNKTSQPSHFQYYADGVLDWNYLASESILNQNHTLDFLMFHNYTMS